MPTRGSPGLVELRLGLLGEPVEQRLHVAPSASGESTVTVPPELPNPRAVPASAR